MSIKLLAVAYKLGTTSFLDLFRLEGKRFAPVKFCIRLTFQNSSVGG